MRRLAALLACTALAACSLEPHYVRPTPAIPASLPVGGPIPLDSGAPLPVVTYQQIFRGPNLQAIIVQALANSQDLRQALANIASARALYRVQRAALLPEIDASAGATVRRTSNSSNTFGTTGTTNTGTATTGTDTSTGTGSTTGTTTGTGTGTTTVTTSNTGNTVTTYQIQGGTTAWEIDLFGRQRSLSHAAFDQYLGTAAAARATRLTLVADIADAYLTLAADRSLLAVAVDTEKSAQSSVDLTRLRLNGGVAPRTDLRQAETVLATARADRARQITLVAQDRNALELLVGAPVADGLLPASIEAVDGTIGELPAGLDSTVLLRRPDVVEAEYQLRAANARIGAARAAFFPTISLTGLVGLSSTALSTLFTGGALTATLAPSATLPIFDAGANAGNLAYSKAQRDAYTAIYQRTVQTAFREVADGLARRATIEQEVAADTLNLEAAQDTLALEDARYREGVDPYLNTLDAQRTLYNARILIARARLTRAQNLVTLYQTLGGDQLTTADR